MISDDRSENATESSGGVDILDERIEAVLSKERAVLSQLRDLMIKSNTDEERVSQLRGLIDHLDELFLLVVVGEVKAGKSSFINSVIGEKVCEEGAIPVTDKVHILKYGESAKERIINDFLIEKYLPHEKLKTLHIVDTPGTNSVIRQHQEITEDFIPRCDLVLFTTSVDRPFSETEHKFLELIAGGWSRKIVFILTKVDIKEESEIADVLTYIRDCSKKFFNQEYKIFPVSSKLAFNAKRDGDEEAYRKSGFKALEDYLFDELNKGEKLALKLHSPVNAATKMCDQTLSDFKGRLELLKGDTETAQTIEAQLSQSEKDLNENYGRFLLEADNVLFEFEKRGRNWLDDNVKISNFGMLRNPERFRNAFTAQVVSDFDQKLEQVFHHAVDWFTQRNLRVWQDTLQYFNDHVDQASAEGKMIGTVATQFHYNREEVFEAVRRDATEQISQFDREGQVRKMVQGASSALSTALGISLIGVAGATLTVGLAAGFTMIDISGILAGLTIVGASLFVLPAKRSKMKSHFSDKIAELRKALNDVMRRQIESEARDAMQRIRDVIRPYSDFCNREGNLIRERIETVESLKTQLVSIRNDLQEIAPLN